MKVKDLLAESDFNYLKDHKIKLDDEEREQAMKAGCVWHFSNHDKPCCAIWKAKQKDGKIVYGSNTHRAWRKAPTLKGAINDFKFIKSTS
jgi:lipopolysaccharide biosynthesis glycosyltransferase